MLNTEMGVRREFENKDAILTRADAVGHALYGPYEVLPAGRYAVEFQIAAAGHTSPNEVVAVVDVTSAFGQEDIAFDYVLGADLAAGTLVRLEFDLPTERMVEYRVRTNGIAAPLIQDLPRVSQRQDGTVARSRIPSIDEGALPAWREALKELYLAGTTLRFEEGEIRLSLRDLGPVLSHLLGIEAIRGHANRVIAEAISFRGDDVNALYRAFVGTDRPLSSSPERVPLTSAFCQQAHFALDQYRYWAHALKTKPSFSRKQWEFFFIAQALFERGMLQPGRRGLVFGAGQEQLPSLFASFGVEILASDQAPESAEAGGWSKTGQHTYNLAALNAQSICTDQMFRKLVSYRSVDMNAIPQDLDGQFDFCWSACSLEHLGSLEHGLIFVENSMRTLRPGGVAVHTTEFNLSSNADTLESEHCSFYRRRDIEALALRLAAKGFEISPVDWAMGEGFAETVIDLPPFGRGEPHIRLRAAGYDVTSIGLIVRSP